MSSRVEKSREWFLDDSLCSFLVYHQRAVKLAKSMQEPAWGSYEMNENS